MLIRKLLRDMNRNKTQFISIFLLVALGTLIFSGLSCLGTGMKQSGEEFYEETNLADAFVQGSSFTNESIEQLRNATGINGAEGRLQTDCKVDKAEDTVLQMNYVSTNDISSFTVMEGEEFSSNINGIWLDQEFADANKIELGDEVTYTMSNEKVTKKVVGLILHPEYVYCVKDESQALPDHKTYGFGFAYLEKGLQDCVNQILLDTDQSKTDLQAQLSTMFKGQYWMLVMQTDQQSVAMFHNEINQMDQMQIIFPAAFLIIAILTILTTMTRLTINQRQQIGVLKALGFSNRKIIVHYTEYGLVISLVGAILGTILGVVGLTPLCFDMERSMYSLPKWSVTPEWKVYFVILICTFLCCLCSFIAARKELKGVPAQVLRPKAAKVAKSMKMENSNWWKKRKFDTQWNLRDCIRNKLRGAITIFGVTGSMMLVICGFGMRDTMNAMIDYSYERANTYEKKISLSPDKTQEQREALMNMDSVQLIQESVVEVLGKDKKIKTTNMTVMGEGSYLQGLDSDFDPVDFSEGGVTITKKLSKELDLSIGDVISFHLYGDENWFEDSITGIIENPIGQGIFIPKNQYEKVGGVFAETAALTGEDSSMIEDSICAAVQTKKAQIDSMEDMLSIMNMMVLIMILAAVVLGAVVLYNLGVLSFYERVRDFATLKVLGFQYTRLQRLLQMQNIWLTLIGCVIGLPAGYFLLQIMMTTMGDSFAMPGIVSIVTYAISTIGVLILSTFVSYFLSRKLKKIDMVSSLKAVE